MDLLWLYANLGALAAGAALWLAGLLAGRKPRARRLLRRLRRLALLVPLASLLWYGWLFTRPQPPPLAETPVFAGVTYQRDVRREPRPLVIHVVRVDLDAPGIRLLVTPPAPGQDGDRPARTTAGFLAEFEAQVALNGSFFQPWWARALWDYYPKAGDPVRPNGLTASEGVVTSPRERQLPTLFLSPENRASFDEPAGEVYNALSGSHLLLAEGEVPTSLAQGDRDAALHPRSAVALDASRRTLLLVAVDGRQPRYSAGATLAELGAIIREHGGHTALNLDGGGSTALVRAGPGGRPVTLNSPIEHKLPGRQRPVATHLGVFAPPLGRN